MKLLFRSYLASLRERGELDAILPDLLSELGYFVYSRPQRGTSQAGVDIAAIGKDDSGEKKVYLFSVKQGDLTRSSWDTGTQALRPSLNQILDTYIRTRIPKRFKELKVVICIVFGGDMQEQVRSDVEGYMENNSTDRISFDEWNGDRIAGLLLQGLLREEIMPKELRSYFQKAVALVDEPNISYQYFSQLVRSLSRNLTDQKSRVRVARQLYIALWVLYVWARDADNLEAPYRASELVILNLWNLNRTFLGKKATLDSKAVFAVLHGATELHLMIACQFLEGKILPNVEVRDGVSSAIRTHSSVDINLKLFEVLGRIALTGIWFYWTLERAGVGGPDAERMKEQVAQLAEKGFMLIQNNQALFLPLQDQQAIEISLFLYFIVLVDGNRADARAWLGQMVNLFAFTVRTHGYYPCVFTEYRDLVSHPREQTEEYRKEATAGSILIPILAAFLSAMGDGNAFGKLSALKSEELKHCTIQLWMPDSSTEDGIYIGGQDHGTALTELPLSETGRPLLSTIREACHHSAEFFSLSAIKSGFWPVILTACRHYRLPVPPHFWIKMLQVPSDNPDKVTS